MNVFSKYSTLPGTLHNYDRQRLQIFIGQTDWNDEFILDRLAKQIADEIGEADGILILDPTSFPKKGKESVGVQRQWCGRLKIVRWQHSLRMQVVLNLHW